ncbi:MAG: InlB B-repeat-containing protein, partial [Clostridia bacterium]
ITLTAHWTVNKYTVTFDYQGKGTGVATKEVTFGQAYGELPLPTHADFNFVGWYTAIDSGVKIEATTIVAEASDITLYAKWTQKAQSTIRFVTNGGTEVASIVKTYGEATWLNEITTTKTGYTFAGWYSDVLLTQEVTTTSIIEKASIDLYAKWTINS